MWPPRRRFNPPAGAPVGDAMGKLQEVLQRLVNHDARWQQRYRLLTELLKPITTAPWHVRGNRAATAWRELVFRGVKWKPAGLLPGRAAQSGSTPSLCPSVSKRPMRRLTNVGG